MSKRSTKTEKFLATARQRFSSASDAEHGIRAAALEDIAFRVGEQWPEHIQRERNLDSRPCLTINRLPQFLKSICNEQRQNRPAIQVSPVDDNTDPETAEVLQGICRHIEGASNADVAYDTAFEFAATMGFGWFRVITDYCDSESFDQDIIIRTITNPFTVYCDPNAKEADRSDMQWCFIIDDLSKDDYEKEFPDSDITGLPDFSSIGDQAPGWFTDESVRIAEYLYIDHKTRTLCQLADGSIAYKDEVPDDAVIERERSVEVPTVKWCKINGLEILEETEWPGRWIPIIPVLGDEINVDGKRHLIGVVRFAKDAQRAYNYWTSAKTEMIALAPRAPYIGAEGQFEGHENQWGVANNRNLAYLEYKPKALNGSLLGSPQRQSYEPPIQAISMALQQASDDLYATTGIYQASLGDKSNETSGRAILARQEQGDSANFHFIDNLARSIKHCGRILIDLIPHIYDTARVVRIVGEDKSSKTVKVNQPFEEGGIQKIYALGAGKYDVGVEMGSYALKRQKAVASMLELTKAYPQLVEIAGDLVVANMDWPGASDISERLKKMLPPQLQDDEGDAPPVPPAIQQQLQQSGMMIEQLTKTVHQLQDEIDIKKVEMDSRERIVSIQEETKRTIAIAQLNQQEGLALLENELATIRHRLDMQSAAEQMGQKQAHEQGQLQAKQEHEQGQQQATQEHAAGMQQSAQEAAAQQAAQQPAPA